MAKEKQFILFILTGVLLTSIFGFWQIQRYNYKLSINSAIESSLKDPQKFNRDGLEKHRAYLVTGYYDFSKQILLGPRSKNKEIGKYIYTVFYVYGKIPLLVNRGFVSDKYADNIVKTGKSAYQTLKVFSYDKPKLGWFAPNNIPEKNLWHSLNLEEIRGELDTPFPDLYFRNIEGDDASKYKVSNVHKKYIYFWFLTSATLLAMLLIARRLGLSRFFSSE